ncbi:MAG TPA: glycine zipper 2TM domain-containing protein [Steroidobacteraceae bacterium]|nr:glycine zipper 2TM domain-containing protein [Steroidobacteraceae bacterium]
MDKSMVKGLVIGAVVAVTGGAVAGYKLIDSQPKFAEVLAVEQVTKTVRTPREVCRDEVVTQQAPTRDPKRLTGTAIGAVVGGVLGNQIGDGSGRTVATVAGAAAGGYAGNRVQERMQKGNTVQTTEQRCTTVYDTHKEPQGYDVRYRLDETEGTVRMQHDPGKRIAVKDGALVIDAPAEG